jgi:hypothetical protein
LVLCAALVFLAASAQATPLGLQVGDKIQQFEWDALQSVPGDGGAWDVSSGIFHADGRINSVQLLEGPSAPTITPSGVTMRFDLGLLSQSVDLSNYPIAFANATLPGAFVNIPSFEIFEGNVSILSGQFSIPLFLQGEFNVLDSTPQPLSAVGRVTVTGGDPNLVAAIGPGGAANLLLDGTIFGFDPPLSSLAGDLNIFNSSFTVSLSGTLIPILPSPFVPEPTTALLLGAGLLGLLAMGRWRHR